MASKLIRNQPLKFHGGKSYLASWLHSLAPPALDNKPKRGFYYTHRNIVFAGGLGEFWNWLPIKNVSECVNDTNEELVNFYEVLKDATSFKLFAKIVNMTPLSRHTFNSVGTRRTPDTVDVPLAHDFFVRYRMSRQGLGRDYATPTTRLRGGMNENVSAYLSAVDGLADCHERLRRVELECLDFREFIYKRDHDKALFYLDPPYVHSTRTTPGGREYRGHEMSDADHTDLLDQLTAIDGKFMLSGYRSKMYDAWAKKNYYNRHDMLTDAKSSSKKTKDDRIESLWTNY
jgi:DNA adenine methylase